MRLQTPEKIRDLQRKLYLKAEREFACLEVKMIGKPYAGELHVRFDEGEQDFVSRKILNGHEAGNSGYSQGSTYQMLSLFSTLPSKPCEYVTRIPMKNSKGSVVYYLYFASQKPVASKIVQTTGTALTNFRNRFHGSHT